MPLLSLLIWTLFLAMVRASNGALIELNHQIVRACRSPDVSFETFKGILEGRNEFDLNIPVILDHENHHLTESQPTTTLFSCIFTPFYSFEKVEFLLQNGARPDDFSIAGGLTPLLFAVGRGNRELVSLLLRFGADFNKIDDDGFYSLSLAFQLKNVDMIRFLLRFILDYEEQKDEDGVVVLPAMTEMYQEADLSMQMVLLEEVDEEYKAEVAFELGFIEAFKRFVKPGSKSRRDSRFRRFIEDPVFRDRDITFAAKKGDIFMIEVLLITESGNPDSLACEALMIASCSGREELVRFLVQKPYEYAGTINACLRYAVLSGHLSVIKVLLENGADVHFRDDYVLRVAAREGLIEIARVSIEFGADIHAAEDEALKSAQSAGHWDIVMLLLMQ